MCSPHGTRLIPLEVLAINCPVKKEREEAIYGRPPEIKDWGRKYDPARED